MERVVTSRGRLYSYSCEGWAGFFVPDKGEQMHGLLAFLFFLGTSGSPVAAVPISSYGAYPNDGLDDTTAINLAITKVKDGDLISFEAGVYDLITPRDQYRHIYFYNKSGITLQGAVTTNGAPATTLLRHVTETNNPSPPRLVNITGGSNITIRNFVMDNTPHRCSAGTIAEVDPAGKYVKVRIFDSLPMDDGTACYSANAWESATRDLKEAESLTYGTSPGFWQVVDPANRIMKLENSAGLEFLNRIAVGDYMSWHYGVHIGGNEPQIRVDTTKNLTFENLRIPNVMNMGVLVGGADGVTLRNITMRPEGEMLQVGPADGIHLSRCSGAITATGLDITGVRWDGFVVHAPYGTITNITSTTNFMISMVASTSGQTIYAGSKLRFLDAAGAITERTVGSNAVHQLIDGQSCYTIVLTEPLPAFAGAGTFLKVEDISPDSVTVKDSNFENIAGSAQILLADHITVSNATHRKIMYSAAHIGSNDGTGIAGDTIQVLDSVFDKCGWMAKTTLTPGILTIANLHNIATNGVVRNVMVKNNRFKNQLFSPANPAVNVMDIDTLAISSNTFENVYCGLKINTATVLGWQVSGNTVIIDNDDNTATYAEVSGSFSASGLKGYNNSTTRYSSSSNAVARWQLICPASGSYAVYIYKVVHSASDSNALISIGHGGGTVTTNLNYTVGSSGWQYLGMYNYIGQQTYTLSNQRQSGYLRADAVKFIQQ